MGKLKAFVINLNGNNPVYFAGSSVEGNVLLELTEPKQTQGISIVLSGQAYTHWTEQHHYHDHHGHHHHGHHHHHHHGAGSHTETVHYTDSEIILNNVVLQLWGSGRDSQQIAPGRYEFPFNFQLPSNLVLPTSFEGTVGYIRYSLTATIARSWKFNHTTKRAITVNEIVDINVPQLTAPLSSSNEKTVCCLCCASGPISLAVTIDRGGYCPGESIAISTEAENHTNRRIRAVRASLEQRAVYYARGHSRTSNRTVQTIEGPGMEAGGTSNWSNELLPIPATVPSIASCRILNVSYVLHVSLDIPNAIDLQVSLPITIGNIPFKGGQSAPSTAPAQNPYPSVGNPGGEPSTNVAQNPYPPATITPNPPSAWTAEPITQNAYPPPIVNYSAAYPPVNIGDDNYTMGETQYAPVYGFVTDYKFAPPPSYSEAVAKVKGPEN
ncbi:arrestin domain-containing protein 3-like [Dysidea avara]|uniref:arrestin domain-containing protein 3-like n=1 Tax=Dysidea avara TaxID=196820 RepID=UPI00332A21CA